MLEGEKNKIVIDALEDTEKGKLHTLYSNIDPTPHNEGHSHLLGDDSKLKFRGPKCNQLQENSFRTDLVKKINDFDPFDSGYADDAYVLGRKFNNFEKFCGHLTSGPAYDAYKEKLNFIHSKLPNNSLLREIVTPTNR